MSAGKNEGGSDEKTYTYETRKKKCARSLHPTPPVVGLLLFFP